jgi:hypothetical protein
MERRVDTSFHEKTTNFLWDNITQDTVFYYTSIFYYVLENVFSIIVLTSILE